MCVSHSCVSDVIYEPVTCAVTLWVMHTLNKLKLVKI